MPDHGKISGNGDFGEPLQVLSAGFRKKLWMSCCNLQHGTRFNIAWYPIVFCSSAFQKLRENIRSNTSYTFDEREPLDLFGDNKYRIDTLFPITSSKGPTGAVLLLHYRNVPPSEQVCAKLLADIISEHIINQ